jgi:hypothetical protein
MAKRIIKLINDIARVVNADPAVGDLLKVSFQLDDPPRSQIQKKVVIRNISPPLIGTEFAPTETLDKALGFYLRS